MDSKLTGALIQRLRNEKGLTQTALAEQLNISNRTVSKWENGDGFPDIGILQDLAAALGVTTDELLAGEIKPREVEAAPIEEARTYPIFRFFTDKIRCADFAADYRQALKETLPLWLRILICVVLLLGGACLAKLVADKSGDFAFAGWVAAFAAFLAILTLFSEWFTGRTKLLQVRQMNGGTLPPWEMELSDRLYLSCGTEHQVFELSAISGFYTQKHHYVIRLYKNVFTAVPKDAVAPENRDAFERYLRSFAVNRKRPLGYTLLHIWMALTFALTAVVLSATLLMHAAWPLTVTKILEANSEDLYNDFYDYYADADEEALNDKQLAAGRVADFYEEYENGGLCQYFTNLSGEHAAELEQNLHTLGLNETADTYAEIVKEYNIDLNRYKEETDYDEELKRYDFNTIDLWLSSPVKKEHIPDAIASYIRANAEAFATEGEDKSD